MAKKSAVSSPASTGADEEDKGQGAEGGAPLLDADPSTVNPGGDASTDQAEPGSQPDADPDVAQAWPVTATLRNNSHLSIEDPVSGIFLEAGGHRTVQIANEEHADKLTTGFFELVKSAGHVVGDFVIEGLSATQKD